MGIFNDSASVNAFAINAYCIVSSLFFSACAYAQLNDPNPVQWFCAYVFGGTVPNLYWMTTTTGSSSSNSNSNSKMVLSLRGFVILLALAILTKLVTVAPKMLLEDDDVSEHQHHGILWAFMEHEEGRDSCGLLLLILHTSYLTSVINARGGGARNPRRSPRNSSDGGDTVAASASGAKALPPALVAVVLSSVLGYCVYVWVVHHSDMVAKYGLKHCQGEMFGRVDGGEL